MSFEETQGKPIVCDAMVLRAKNTPMQVEKITVAPPKRGEVRCKVLFSSCCHTDLLVIEGLDPETPPEGGVILGHEAFAVVESVGEGVTSVKVGDHVVPAYVPECGECRFCKNPNTNLCQSIRSFQGRGVMPDNTVRYTDAQGNDIRHFMNVSAFSQYIVTTEISVVKVTDKAAATQGKNLPVVGCGWTTGYYSPITAGVKPGSSVAVVGLGAVGLAAIVGAKAQGATQIIAIDINPEKFELAKKLGATHVVNPRELAEGKSLQNTVMEMTEGGWGVDFAFECVGNNELMRACLEMTTKGWGKAFVIGVGFKEISIKSFYLVSGRQFTGAAFGGIKSRSQLPGLIEEIGEGKIDLSSFITNERPLSEVNEAFEDMKKGKTIRTVINMW